MTINDELFLARHGLPEDASIEERRTAIDHVLEQAIDNAKTDSSQTRPDVEQGPGSGFKVVLKQVS